MLHQQSVSRGNRDACQHTHRVQFMHSRPLPLYGAPCQNPVLTVACVCVCLYVQEMLSAGRLSWQGQPRRQHQGLGALTEATPRLAVDLNDLVATQDTWRLASTAATLSKAGSTKQQLEAVLRKLAAEEGGFGQSVPLLKAQR